MSHAVAGGGQLDVSMLTHQKTSERDIKVEMSMGERTYRNSEIS
jgi:hypothetical protein